jgi:hypothetical protein
LRRCGGSMCRCGTDPVAHVCETAARAQQILALDGYLI